MDIRPATFERLGIKTFIDGAREQINDFMLLQLAKSNDRKVVLSSYSLI